MKFGMPSHICIHIIRFSLLLLLLHSFLEYTQCPSLNFKGKSTDPLPFCPLAEQAVSPYDEDESYRSTIQFSNKALHLLMEYRSNFPLLFEQIRDSDTSHAIENFDEQMVKDAQAYCENLNFKKDSHMIQFSHCASPKHAKILSDLGEKSTLFKKCNYHVQLPATDLAFWELDNFTPSIASLTNVVPAIGDRVVITAGNDVPIGMYGFVVAVHPTCRRVELVMDKPFIGGTNLLGLLESPYRGA